MTKLQLLQFALLFACFTLTSSLSKKKLPPPRCICYANRALNYRTFDSALIQYLGTCSYVLAQHTNRKSQCQFSVIANNARTRSGFRYTKSIDIRMFGAVFRLGPGLRVSVNNKMKGVSYTMDKKGKQKIRVFRSGRFIQFVAPKCDVQVAFDGKNNAILSVNRAYSGRVRGMCGNCNRNKLDDFVTRSGKLVVKHPHRSNLIGNSWAARKSCPPTNANPNHLCSTGQLKKIASSNQMCGWLTKRNGPFKKCLDKAKLNVRELRKMCLISMCSANSAHSKNARCEFFKLIDEACAERGFSGIVWRSVYRCPLMCGRNKFYNARANPCPRTCENHWYGTKSLCYKLPRREACQCRRGFLRDGELCVRPNKCRCLECQNAKPSKLCALFKRQNKCKQFPLQMFYQCRLACGMCKKHKKHRCVDNVLSERCQHFLKTGKCRHRFYQMICAKTCRSKKCLQCPTRTRRIDKLCHSVLKVRRIFIVYYVRNLSQSKCIRKTRIFYKRCGKCNRYFRRVGKCNFCRRIRIITHFTWFRNKAGFCSRKPRVRVTKHRCLRRCLRNYRKHSRCHGNHLAITKTSYNIQINCFVCKRLTRTQSRIIKCPKSGAKSHCNRRSCRFTQTFVTYRLSKCRCYRRIRWLIRKCCCPKTQFRKGCYKNRPTLFITKFYLRHYRCYWKTTSRPIRKVCPPPRFLSATKCNRKLCHRVIRYAKFVLFRCQCKRIVTAMGLRCCCKKPFLTKQCIEKIGQLIHTRTWFNVKFKYRLFKFRHFICLKRTKRTIKNVRCRKIPQRIVGKCNRFSCRRKINILIAYRKKCRCYLRRVIRYQICCCKASPKVRRTCIRNRIKITQTLVRRLRFGVCRYVVIRNIKQVVSCPKTRVYPGRCDPRGGTTIDRIVAWRILTCHCKRHVTSKKRICPTTICPLKPRPSQRHCNRKTCIRTDVFWFINKKKCSYFKKFQRSRCCCHHLKTQNWKKCNRRSGFFEAFRRTFKLNPVAKRCTQIVRRIHVFKFKCPGKRIVETGKCGKPRPYYALVKTTKFHHLRHACRCRKLVTTRHIRCSCPPPRRIRVYCGRKNNRPAVITVTRHYVLKHLRCHVIHRSRAVFVKYKPIPKPSRSKCVRCRFTIKTYQRFFRNCHCYIRTITRHLKCCCPKPQIKTFKCIKHRVKIQKIKTWRLYRYQCILKVTTRTRTYRCKKTHIRLRSKCISCNFKITDLYYRIQNCNRCKLIRKLVRPYKCCCPKKSQKYSVCKNTYILRSIIAWRWIKYKCIKKVHNEVVRILCKGRKVTHGKCHPSRPYRITSVVFHVVRKCKCHRVSKFYKFPCKCARKPSIFKRTKCVGMFRFVLKYVYKRVGKVCRYVLHRKVREHCKCRKSATKITCHPNGKLHVRVITYWRLNLVNHGAFKIFKCKRMIRIRHVHFKCARPYIKWSKCFRNRHCLYRIFRMKSKCKCIRRHRIIRCKVCNCRYIHRKRKVCMGNFYRIFTYTQRVHRNQCLVKNSKTDRKIPCKPLVKTIVRHQCNIRRGRHMYQKVVRLTRALCKCKCCVKKQVAYGLCKCHNHLKPKTVCHKNRFWLTTIYYMVKNGQKCQIRSKSKSKAKKCPRPTLRLYKKCYRYFVKYVEITYRIHKCRCYAKRRRFINNRCRCSKSTRTIKCIRNKRVYEIISYQLKQTRQLLSRYSRIRKLICAIKRQTKVFPLYCRRRPFVTHHCNHKTKVYTKKTHYFKLVNCKCVRTTKTKTGHCRCHKTQVRRFKCIGYFRWVHVTRYFFKSGRCIGKLSKYRERCRCKSTSVRRWCSKKNEWVKRVVRYILKTKPPCQSSVKITRNPVRCTKQIRLFKVYPCNRKTRSQRVVYYRYELLKCQCLRRYFSKNRICSCPKCHRRYNGCSGNRKRYRITCHRLFTSNGRKYCKIFFRYRYVPVICKRNQLIKLTNCQPNGFQKFRQIRWSIRNCRCHKNERILRFICNCSRIHKPRTVHSCNKKTNIKTVITYFWILFKRRCIRKSRGIRRSTRCRRIIRHRFTSRCNRKNCLRSIITVVYRPKDCRCQWIVIRRWRQKCCCLQKPIFKKTCLNRQNRWKHSKIIFSLYKGACIRREYLKYTKVKCNSKPTRPVRRCQKNCRGTLSWYRFVPNNCRCQRRLVRSIKIACCCSKKVIQITNCNAKIGIRNYISIRFVLSGHRCIRKRFVRPHMIRCATSNCKFLFTKCVANKYLRKIYCYRRRGCACKRVFVKRDVLGCQCSKRRWTTKGPCNKKTGRQFLYIWGIYFDNKINRCRKRILNRSLIRCKCPPKKTVHKCKGTYYQVITTYYILRNGRCHRRQIRGIKHIRHCKVGIFFIRRTRCNKKTGYYTKIMQRKYIGNCRCLARAIPYRRICNCNKIIKPTRSVKCVHHRRRIVTRVYYVVNKLHTRCKRIVKSISYLIRCPVGIRKFTKHCRNYRRPLRNGAVSYRFIEFYRLGYYQCRCTRRKLKVIVQHCRCAKTKHSQRCLAHRTILHTTKHYRLAFKVVRGERILRCKLSTQTRHQKIPCYEKLRKFRTKCHKNVYYIIKSQNKLKNCKCSRVFYRRSHCHCRCRTNINNRVYCSRNYKLYRLSRIARKINCRCTYKTKKIYFMPKCPRITPNKRGPCRRYRNHGLRVIFYFSLVRYRSVCKCSVRVIRQKRVCWCRPRIHRFSKCSRNIVSNYLRVFILDRRRNACVQRQRFINKRVIRCKPNRIDHGHCDQKRNLRINRYLIKYYIRNCKCLRLRRKLPSIPCKCHDKFQLIKRGRCNRACRRSDQYLRYKYINKQCIPVKKYFTRICCCPKPKTIHTCHKHMFIVISRISYRLDRQRNVCIRRVHPIRRQIKCHLIKLVRKVCTRAGILIRVYSIRYNYQCKCRTRIHHNRALRCKCPKPSIYKNCNIRSGKQVFRTITYRLLNGRCYRRVFNRTKILRCRGPIRTTTKCIRPVKSIRYYRYITITRYRIASNRFSQCFCKRHASRHRVLCGCSLKRHHQTKCLNPTKGLIMITVSFWRQRGDVCIRVVRKIYRRNACPRVIPRPGRCNAKNQRLIMIPQFYFKNCRCHVRWVRRICNCKCKSGVLHKCIRNNLKWYRRYIGFFKQCRCRIRYLRPYTRRVVCSKKVHRKVSRCFKNCRKLVTLFGYRPINCRCYVRPIRRYHAVCCCRPSVRYQNYCQAKTGIFIRKMIRYVVNAKVNRCMPIVRVRKIPTRCRTIPICKPYGQCNKNIGKQRYICFRYIRIGCRCHIRRSGIFKLCPCHKQKFVKISCNRKTCRGGRALIFYRRHPRTKQCIRYRKVFSEACCCHRNRQQQFVCIRNRRFLRIRYLTFNPQKKQCQYVVKLLSRPVRCPRGPRRYPQKCNRRNCKREILVRIWFKASCKCHSRLRNYKIMCCCTHLKPYKRSYCRNRVWTHVSVTYHLHRNRCVKRRHVALAKIFCGRRKHTVGRCNRVNCKQSFSNVWYIISSKCKCIRQVRTIYKTCCCSKKYSLRYHRCDAKTGHKIFTKLSLRYNARTRNCDRHFEFQRSKVVCPFKRFFSKSGCKFIANVGFVRKLTVRFNIRVACRCILISRTYHQLCRCRKPFVRFFCQKNRLFKSVVRFVRLNRVITVYRSGKIQIRVNLFFCRAMPRKTSLQRLPPCSRKIRRIIGRCKKNGYLNYTVIQRIRKSCKCVAVTRSYKIKCHCNAKKHVVKRCFGNRIIVSVYKRVFRCTKRINPPHCGCPIKRISIKTQRLKPCPLPKVLRITRCTRPNQVYHHIRYVYYRRKYCRCWRRTFNHPIQCKKRCANTLLTAHCVYLNKRYNMCRLRHLNNVQKLCARTCGICEKCPHKMLTFHTHKGFSYLQSIPKNRIHLFVLRMTYGKAARHCSQHCKKTSHCKAFEIHRHNRRLICTMFKVSLREAINHHGIQLKWNKHKRTYTKYCGCSKSKKILRQSKCRCVTVPGQIRYCFKRVQLQIWRRIRNKCRQIKPFIKVPCRSCKNSANHAWCRSHRKRCLLKSVRSKCQAVCSRACRHCYGLIGVYQVCDARRKKWKFVTVAYKSGGRKSNVCMIKEFVRWGPSCSRCQPGNEIHHISTCSSLTNTRLVIRIVVVHNPKAKRCIVRMIRHRYSCGACRTKLIHRVGKCQRGKRVSQFHFWYKAKSNGRCMRKVITDVYPCDNKKCPKDIIKRGKCCISWSKVIRIWFVKLPNNRCQAKRSVTFKKCTQRRTNYQGFLF